jgi:hypothetical protein
VIEAPAKAGRILSTEDDDTNRSRVAPRIGAEDDRTPILDLPMACTTCAAKDNSLMGYLPLLPTSESDSELMWNELAV